MSRCNGLRIQGVDAFDWVEGLIACWKSGDEVDREHAYSYSRALVYGEVRTFVDYEGCWWYRSWVENVDRLKDAYTKVRLDVDLLFNVVLMVRRLGLLVKHVGMDEMNLQDGVMESLGEEVYEEVKWWETTGMMGVMNVDKDVIASYYLNGFERYIDATLDWIKEYDRLVYTGKIVYQ